MAYMDFILLIVCTSYLTRCWRSSLNMMFIKLTKWNAISYHTLLFCSLYRIRQNGWPHFWYVMWSDFISTVGLCMQDYKFKCCSYDLCHPG